MEWIVLVEQERTSAQGQDNAADSTGQRVQTFYAPWFVLGVWLLIDFIYAAYFRFTEWGPEGGVPQVIAFVANAIALGGWLTVWLLLSSQKWPARFAYLLAGFAGLFTISFFGDSGGIDLFLEFPKLIVGAGIVLFAIRRCGRQICPYNHATNGKDGDDRRRLQFSIIDLIILTTSTASFVGLLIANGTTELALDFAYTGMFIFTVVLVPVLILALRRYWIAFVACLVSEPAAMCAADWLTGNQYNRLYVGLSVGAGACLLIAASALRVCGYRFTPGCRNPPSPVVPLPR